MPKRDLNKVASNFVGLALRHGCSPVNLLHIFRTPFLKNISGQLLLNVVSRNINSDILKQSSSIYTLYYINFSSDKAKKSFRSSHRRCSVKKGVVRNFAKFTWKKPVPDLFFNKVAVLGLQLYWKRDSGTGVFLWILRNF